MAYSPGRSWLALLGAAVLLGLVPGTVAAGTVTRYVDDDGHAGSAGCDSTRTAPRRIQRAIDLSGPGDTILVCPGVYREHLTIGAGKGGLKLRSIRPGKAVVRTPPPDVAAAGVAPAGGVAQVRIAFAHGVRFRGFSVVVPTTAPCLLVHFGIQVGPDADGALVAGNVVRAAGSDTLGDTSGCGYHYGISASDGPVTISGNTVRDFRSAGILVQGSGTSGAISENTVSYLHADEGGSPPSCNAGIFVGHEMVGSVLDNDVVGLATAGSGTPQLCVGIFADDAGSDLVIRRNLVRYAEIGLEIDYGISARVTGNTLRNNRMWGLYLKDADDTLVRNNLVRGYSQNGIWVTADSSDLLLDANDVAGAGSPDCLDESSGIKVGAPYFSTANTWTGNTGLVGDPAGICTP